MTKAQKWIAPMKAVSGDIPPGTGWAAELKWDGMRIHASISEGSIQLRSSNGRDVTSCFPELDRLGQTLGSPAVLDGEVVVFDGDLPSFSRLQKRIHIEKPNQTLLRSNPIVFMVFDLLMLGDQSLEPLPYRERRKLLADFLPPGPTWKASAAVEDGAEDLLDFARERNLEGIVVKRLSSTYQSGARSQDWIKVKIRLRQEFVVVGWLPGQGALENQIGSILIAVNETEPDSDGGQPALRFAGAVGSGLSDGERNRLAGLFSERSEAPIIDLPSLGKRPTWVEPSQVVEVEYAEWPIGGVLRHPVYAGLRIDTDPNAVVRELR